jgi:hypothetical protein
MRNELIILLTEVVKHCDKVNTQIYETLQGEMAAKAWMRYSIPELLQYLECNKFDGVESPKE